MWPCQHTTSQQLRGGFSSGTMRDICSVVSKIMSSKPLRSKPVVVHWLETTAAIEVREFTGYGSTHIRYHCAKQPPAGWLAQWWRGWLIGIVAASVYVAHHPGSPKMNAADKFCTHPPSAVLVLIDRDKTPLSLVDFRAEFRVLAGQPLFTSRYSVKKMPSSCDFT